MNKLERFVNNLAKVEALGFNLMMNKDNQNNKSDDYIDIFG
ncbi:hypothetical protein [Halanaerobium salsuginis]|jgi:hypothetical protein|uniref:Uncharacterized protein n=1 Tax=Halanaerobium salsuginis TaxID=29563 RepID=A0A1I4LCF6_9FIRM|nr:hypothetical protein [Halanaerobium salsuginis]SFL88692.1 hypothetical protein SAMN02983006_02290 [Halanaerobium salsuginis]